MFTEGDLIILGRAALAAALGFAIGWERQVTGSVVKARTIGLAALTATCLTGLGHEIFATGTDRIIQGIITGISFLGAGVIIHGGAGEVRGLTTAASMWAMTGIGVAIGSGHELLGVLLAMLIYLIAAWGDWPLLAVFRRGSRRSAPGTISEHPDHTSASAAKRNKSADEHLQPNRAESVEVEG